MFKLHKFWLILLLPLLILLSLPIYRTKFNTPNTSSAEANNLNEIRASVLAEKRSLPLVGSWNSGADLAFTSSSENFGPGFTPAWQVAQLEAGKHLLPWFETPKMDVNPTDKVWIRYYKEPLAYFKSNNLPISLVGEQLEQLLFSDRSYRNIPYGKNPFTPIENSQDPIIAKLELKLSPLGDSSDYYYEVGKRFAESPIMKQMQEWYPNPPQVLYVHNNEAYKLGWTELSTDTRLKEKYPNVKLNDSKALVEIYQQGFASKYQAMINGIKDGLLKPEWKNNFKVIGYNANGPGHYGRWALWRNYSSYTEDIPDMGALYFNGSSASYYDSVNASGISSKKIWSPQTEAQNWIFMEEKIRKIKPNFWLEYSTWDGGVGNPKQYEGMVQFGMWLQRPKLVRDFRESNRTKNESEVMFNSVISSVERVYSSPILKDFWLNGKLLENTNHLHPYQEIVTKKTGRWFMLDVSTNPNFESCRNNSACLLHMEQKVFAVALRNGDKYLVFAHAPAGNISSNVITIPNFKSITVDVKQEGSFFLVNSDGSISDPFTGTPQQSPAPKPTNLPKKQKYLRLQPSSEEKPTVKSGESITFRAYFDPDGTEGKQPEFEVTDNVNLKWSSGNQSRLGYVAGKKNIFTGKQTGLGSITANYFSTISTVIVEVKK